MLRAAEAVVQTEAVVQRCSVKRVFLEISQNSQESICARASFLKKRLWHRCFPVNFTKFLRTPIFTERLCGCFWSRIDFCHRIQNR